MSVELPPPEYWRCPRLGNDGVLFRSRLQAVANGEQVCEALYTADQLRAAVDSALEAAARKAERMFGGKAHTYASENADLYRAQDDARERIAAAIRAMRGQV